MPKKNIIYHLGKTHLKVCRNEIVRCKRLKKNRMSKKVNCMQMNWHSRHNLILTSKAVLSTVCFSCCFSHMLNFPKVRGALGLFWDSACPEEKFLLGPAISAEQQSWPGISGLRAPQGFGWSFPASPDFLTHRPPPSISLAAD